MPKGADGVCVVERRLAAIAGRFRAEVLNALGDADAHGAPRYGAGLHFAALRRATGASAHSLTRTLRGLEEAGLVSRRRERRWGPCDYALTALGQRTLQLLDQFGADPEGISAPSVEI